MSFLRLLLIGRHAPKPDILTFFIRLVIIYNVEMMRTNKELGVLVVVSYIIGEYTIIRQTLKGL